MNDRRIFFFVLFFLALNWPLLSIPEDGGILYFSCYLLITWILLIGILYFFSRHMIQGNRHK